MRVWTQGKLIDPNVFGMDDLRIYLGTSIMWFGVNPNMWSDVIIKKPDMGRKKCQKTSFFGGFLNKKGFSDKISTLSFNISCLLSRSALYMIFVEIHLE